MGIKSTVVVVLTVTATGFVGSGNAAVVPIEQILELHIPPGELVSSLLRHGQAASERAASGHAHRFGGEGREPGRKGPRWIPDHLDTDTGSDAGTTGAQLNSWAVKDHPAHHAVPFDVALVSAGQHNLQIDTGPPPPVVPKVSAVPLPGALWLFGSALLAFLGFAKRRRT
jgi:hypothetical protein